MSFLREVLSTVQQIEIETVSKKVPELMIRSEKLKNDVISYIENVYVCSNRSDQSDLLKKARNLSSEVEDLCKNIQNISKKEICTMSKEITNYSSELQECTIAVNLVSKVMEIHEGLVKVKELQAEKLFVQVVQETNRILNCIQSIPEDEDLEAILELNISARAEVASLLNTLNNICQDNIICIDTMKNEKQTYVLKFKKPNDELNQALLALSYHNSSVSPLHKVTKFLFMNVFSPIIRAKTSVSTSQENDLVCLSVEILDASSKDQYKDVFSKIFDTVSFLHDNFNYQLQESVSTLSYIGDDLRDNLSELLIKNCLSDTIPSSTEGLQKYKQVIEDTEELQRKLVLSKIFSEDMTSILDYANNVDILFINKKCKDYMQHATSLMKKDLHDFVEIGKPHDINNPLDELMSDDFPQSSVSASTIELLKLAEDIMQKAVTGSDVSAGRLYTTTLNIFDMYGNVIMEHHHKLLRTIPQQVALFYNNCMYISHQLTIWNETYKGKLPSTINAGPAAFKEQPIVLRSLADETFTSYVQLQIKQIEDILKESGLCDTPSLTKLEANTEKCIRQCLRQQELLKTVWQKVLPYTTYNKTLGTILNHVCEFISTAIINIDDISSDAGEQLVDVLKVILTRGPKLFTDPNEINMYVENWGKLKELVLILNGSLIDINERWANGKGPLAIQFKVEEIKRLIRALFQNTEKRAAVLANIYD